MFINFSNHPYSQWSLAQKQAASEYGEIVDMPFPAVPPEAGPDYIQAMSNEYTEKILNMNPSIVMCQGEFTLAFAVITSLISHGIPVVAACSERRVSAIIMDKVTNKNATFEFVRFREYT